LDPLQGKLRGLETARRIYKVKALEYDSVLAWCGSVALGDRKIGKVAVPNYCWKIIFSKRERLVLPEIVVLSGKSNDVQLREHANAWVKFV
jgi:hypothetical protein